MSEHAEDLREAAAAAMRQLLEEARALPALARVARRDYTDARTAAESRQAVSAIEALLARIDEALAGDAGRTFLAHLRRLEAENAELRQDGPRFAVENARIRGLLAHFEHCPHGCQDAGFCPHYKRVRDLGLFGRGPVQTSAPPAPAVVPRSDVHNFGHGPARCTCTCGKGPWCVCGFCQACQGLDLGLPFPVGPA